MILHNFFFGNYSLSRDVSLIYLLLLLSVQQVSIILVFLMARFVYPRDSVSYPASSPWLVSSFWQQTKRVNLPVAVLPSGTFVFHYILDAQLFGPGFDYIGCGTFQNHANTARKIVALILFSWRVVAAKSRRTHARTQTLTHRYKLKYNLYY
jgi:hypothetical protein